MDGGLQKIISQDIYRASGKYSLSFRERRWYKDTSLLYITTLRKAHYYLYERKRRILGRYYLLRLKRLARKTLYEIPAATNIGPGFYIGHIGPVIIGAQAKIGKNVDVGVGVTIGETNRGPKEGVPTVGNEVWIGANAVIVGNIVIGDNVLIAPNAYVNFDVPGNAIVIGNPGRIIPDKQEACAGYVNNRI